MKYRTLTNLMPFVILYGTKAYDVCNQLKSSALQKATFCNVKGHLSASGLWPFTLSFAAILISTALHAETGTPLPTPFLRNHTVISAHAEAYIPVAKSSFHCSFLRIRKNRLTTFYAANRDVSAMLHIKKNAMANILFLVIWFLSDYLTILQHTANVCPLMTNLPLWYILPTGKQNRPWPRPNNAAGLCAAL